MEKKEIDEQILKELKEEHKDFVEMLKITNEKLDRLVEIMEEARAKPTDNVM